VLIFSLLPSHVHLLISRHSWIEAAGRLTLRVSHETGSAPDIRLAPYKSGLLGVCFSNYSGYGVCWRALNGESKKQFVDQCCGFMFVGKK
jgi:hypothetical protein